MRLFERVVKNCRVRTPTTINFDELEYHTGQVISTLYDVKDALLGVGDLALAAAAFRALEQNWPLIWRWMVVLTKGILKDPAPSTPSGLANARKFVEMSSILLVYSTHNSTRGDAENTDALLRLSQSHPKILVHATELWLRVSELQLGDDVVGPLMHVIGLFLETLVKSGGESGRILKGEPKDKLEIFFTTTNFDLTGTLLKGIALEASRSAPDFNTLRHHFMYINILTLSFSPALLELRASARMGILPRISLTIKSLSRRRFQPFDPQKQSNYAKYLCLLECLQLLTVTILANAYLAIPLLDGGLLLHIFQLKDVVVEHVRHALSHPGLCNPAFVTTRLFACLKQRAVHRPLMVRLVSSIRKVQKLGLDNWDNPLFAPDAPFHSLREQWDDLAVEVTFRNASISAKLTWEAYRSCGNREVSVVNNHYLEQRVSINPETFAVYEYRYVFYRVLSTLWRMRKVAWRAYHKSKCQDVQVKVRAEGRWLPRCPGHFELRLLRFHFAFDYGELFMTKARELCEEYWGKHGALPVIWVDYDKYPPAIEAASNAEFRAKMTVMKSIPERGGIDDLDGTLLVCALIPWQGADSDGSLVVAYHDHVVDLT
ncbi:hypothetical protein AAF712_004611 [Marasmius tenuissimus]|uniref:Uncharacterized protein n=1 Tax=Marasmius tenuissimus TaxID=585030 RepID=A0ABR3A2L7_9AGAR